MFAKSGVNKFQTIPKRYNKLKQSTANMIERLFRNETVTFDTKKTCSRIRPKTS